MLYQPSEDHGIIGNLGTVDLAGIDRFVTALLSHDKKISRPLAQFYGFVKRSLEQMEE